MLKVSKATIEYHLSQVPSCCFKFSYRVGVNVQSRVYLFLSGFCFAYGSQMNDCIAICRQSNGQTLLGKYP
jgi:hypothetical protein